MSAHDPKPAHDDPSDLPFAPTLRKTIIILLIGFATPVIVLLLLVHFISAGAPSEANSTVSADTAPVGQVAKVTLDAIKSGPDIGGLEIVIEQQVAQVCGYLLQHVLGLDAGGLSGYNRGAHKFSLLMPADDTAGVVYLQVLGRAFSPKKSDIAHAGTRIFFPALTTFISPRFAML